MMASTVNIAEYWYNSGFEAYSSRYSGEKDCGDKNIAQKYLSKYSLSRDVGSNRWDDLQKSIFYLNKQLPDMIFKKDFEFITLLGGAMFEEKNFKQFQILLEQLGEKQFVVIQDTYRMDSADRINSLRMIFSANIGWKELMSGNYISTILFESFYNHYYVFGYCGKWGMYVANDYWDPINIIGFDPKYRKIFREAFEIPEGEYCENVDYIPEEERPNLKEWVPKLYRN